jgi:K+-transporting ATPase ATPase C chain
MQSFITSLRVAVVSMLVCVVIYAALVLGIAQLVTPHTANGSLIVNDNATIIGSELIAQKFERPDYFWLRPSAVDYNGAGAGGSNKSPTSPDLTKRAEEIVVKYGATSERPLPPELAAASGGGLDPHITEHAALYQAPRIAQTRGIPQSQIESLIRERAFFPGGILTPDRIVNVLELNLALDETTEAKPPLR